ncbi:hypothetical protein DdX_01203 [Ditylenchus destructor]|uniref:Uncharacterized protein n=1 Tax=Ditylenchus destructor TaxID=166010 RepID=A0AAD4R7X0_9BILA|nr:hypothetical protein DdX_01203 [Ditylenchus destructor]
MCPTRASTNPPHLQLPFYLWRFSPLIAFALLMFFTHSDAKSLYLVARDLPTQTDSLHTDSEPAVVLLRTAKRAHPGFRVPSVAGGSGSGDEQHQFVGCTSKEGHRCSMMVNVLRDPRLIPNWTRDTWSKAIAQFNAYQQLFSANNEMDSMRRRRRRASEPTETEQISDNQLPSFADF